MPIQRLISTFARALRTDPAEALRLVPTAAAEPYLGNSYYAPISFQNLGIGVGAIAWGRIPAGTVLRNVWVGTQCDSIWQQWFQPFSEATWATLQGLLTLSTVPSAPLGSPIRWQKAEPIGPPPYVTVPSYAQILHNGEDPDIARPDMQWEVLTFPEETLWIAQQQTIGGTAHHFAWAYRELDR